MKQKLLSLVLLLCALIVGSGSAWAANFSGTFRKCTGEITSGTYVILEDGGTKGPNNIIASSWITIISGVSVSDDKIINPNENAVWDFDSSTGYLKGNGKDAYIFYSGSGNAGKVQTTSGSKNVISESSPGVYKIYYNSTTSGRMMKVNGTSGYRFYTSATNFNFYKLEDAGSAESTTTTISDTGITNTNIFNGATAGSLTAVVKDESNEEIDGATVSWAGNNNEVATINSSTGAITLVGTGTVTFTATYAGVEDEYASSSDTYEMTVTNEDPDLVTIWSEDFSDYSANDVPAGGTYSYVCVNGNSDTKIYENANAGGESPELLINKNGTNNGSFSATIPLNNGYTGTLKLIFKNNNSINVSVTDNTSAELKSSTAISANTTTGNTVEISGVTAETTSITILWSNSSSSNVRLDDIVLKGKEAPAKPTFSEAAKMFNSSFDMTISSETGTTLKYTTDGTNPAVSGTATSVASNSKTITISGTSDVTVKAISIKDEVISAVASVTYTYDARPAPTFTLSDTEKTIYVNSDDETITLTTNSDGPVTFESSDGEKLDVDNTKDSKVGVMTAIEAGDYTVTVRTAETANFLAGEGTVTVHVIKLPTTITTTASFTSTDLKNALSGSFTGVAKYNDVAIGGAEVTYSSSNTKVATINSSTGVVTYLKAGTTRLTASYAGDDEHAACEVYYDLTLTDTRPQEIVVSPSFNNTFFGISVITSWKTGDPTSATGDLKNVSVTYAKGSGTYFYCNASQIRCYSGNTLSFEAPTGYNISSIAFTSSDWTTATPSVGDMNSSDNKLWEGNSNTVSFSWSSTARIESATITLAPTVTVTASGYLSYCSPHKLDFTDTDVKAYKASVNNTTGQVTLTPVDVVPANTGVILFSSEAKDAGEAKSYAIPVTAEAASDVTGNQMVGVLERTQVLWKVGDNYNYILQQGQFKKATDGYLKANRAYLSTSYNVTATGARALTIVFEDSETTGISLTPNPSPNSEGSVYDLQGRKVSNPGRGLYIVNGKKIMVK